MRRCAAAAVKNRTSNAASQARRFTKSVPFLPPFFPLHSLSSSLTPPLTAQLLELKKELAWLRAEVASLRHDEEKRREEEGKARKAGEAARRERETDLE